MLSLVFVYLNSSQFIADLLWEITEGENNFRTQKILSITDMKIGGKFWTRTGSKYTD